MSFAKYLNRFLALAWLFGLSLIFTSKIGNENPADVTTWSGAWGAVALIAAAMFLGFMSGRESKEE